MLRQSILFVLFVDQATLQCFVTVRELMYVVEPILYAVEGVE